MADTLSDAAISELSATDLAAHLAAGDLPAERVTSVTLRHIAEIDSAGPTLNAVIELNPDAIQIAQRLDAAFREGGPVGPLHGVPIVLKANIDTADQLATSAGSMALAGHHAAADAPLVKALRDAGSVIVAKTNLSEWANFRDNRSISGWSSLGGQTRNPYVLDRNPCGSSSGSAVAVAARLVSLAVGTETDGSIVCPASINGIVGIKPTIGSISQTGIIPIAASQDTAGPMARTVADAALLLTVLGVPVDYQNTTRLDGWRIGVLRDFFGSRQHPRIDAEYQAWLDILVTLGAELVDPAEAGLDRGVIDAELEVLQYEFKAGLQGYLQTTHGSVRDLDALIAYNDANAEAVMPFFGQDLLLESRSRDDLDSPLYLDALVRSRDRVRDQLDELFRSLRLDVLVAPSNAPAWKIDRVHGDRVLLSSSSLAAISGYPSLTVPGALVMELPVGLSLIARPHEEQRLIDAAGAFEIKRGPFPGPRFLPSLE